MEKRKELNEELEAKSRQVYDPINGEFDPRRRRVTDLQECDRVYLPKPLDIVNEANIEARRAMHSKVYEEYRQRNCDKNDEQKTNLEENEARGIKKIQKRLQEKELVYLKTDKSGKGCLATVEKYRELGKEHVEKDEKIDRKVVREIDKILNGHSRAWDKMWATGEAHKHQGRVMSSKTSSSENRADLYLSFKDHKKVQKARPIATQSTSNARALSNSVSDFVESVANSEPNKFETISSEDMLHHTEESNRKMDILRQEWMKRRLRKMKCSSCRTQHLRCKNHQKTRDEGGEREGGGSGEVSWSGSHAPTGPNAPQNIKRLEKLAGERGGTPPPM